MKELLIGTAATILEDWGMLLVDRAQEELQIFSVDEPFYLAELRFNGCVNGTYQVLTQKGFANVLVANLLGEEPHEIEEQTAQDVLRELINVLSGNLLTEQFGVEETFDLSSPAVRIIEKAEAEKFFQQTNFCFRGDDEPVGIACRLEGAL